MVKPIFLLENYISRYIKLNLLNRNIILKGFSLIELLVGLVLSSILLMGFTLLGSGVGAQLAYEDVHEKDDDNDNDDGDGNLVHICSHPPLRLIEPKLALSCPQKNHHHNVRIISGL